MKDCKINNFIRIVCGILIFVSCSSKKSKENATKRSIAPKETVSKFNDTPTVEIDTASVLAWYRMQQNLENTKEVLKNTTNKFSFRLSSDTLKSGYIHAYMGFANERLTFFFVNSNKDTLKNTTCFARAVLDKNSKVKLQKFDTINENNPESISWKLANSNINNWIDNRIRNKWLSSKYHKNKTLAEAVIFLAFVINAKDFEYGVSHDCYLSLKEEKNIHGKTKYTAHLIIVNSNKIVSLVSKRNNANLEDLTAPAPPYGSGNTSYDKMGLLNTLKIK